MIMHGLFSVFTCSLKQSQLESTHLQSTTAETSEPCSPAFKGFQPHTGGSLRVDFSDFTPISINVFVVKFECNKSYQIVQRIRN